MSNDEIEPRASRRSKPDGTCRLCGGNISQHHPLACLEYQLRELREQGAHRDSEIEKLRKRIGLLEGDGK